MKKPNRREEILQALAQMLQENPGGKTTTAALAKQVCISEAALYRHFPSKAKMLEGLIEFAEDTLFGLIGRVLEEQQGASAKCHDILLVLLTFVERNPGFARLFVGDALQGETERLRGRCCQVLDRIETQLRTVLRDERLKIDALPGAKLNPVANLLIAAAEGRILQFVRSDFRLAPTEHWADQWQLLDQIVVTQTAH